MVKMPPVSSVQPPPANLPRRILGPCRSRRMLAGRPNSAATWRMAAMRAACSACVLCDALRRKTSTPARSSCRIAGGESLAGPSVATILVLGIRAGMVPLGASGLPRLRVEGGCGSAPGGSRADGGVRPTSTLWDFQAGRLTRNLLEQILVMLLVQARYGEIGRASCRE